MVLKAQQQIVSISIYLIRPLLIFCHGCFVTDAIILLFILDDDLKSVQIFNVKAKRDYITNRTPPQIHFSPLHY